MIWVKHTSNVIKSSRYNNLIWREQQLFNIEKLDEKNCDSWYVQVLSVVIRTVEDGIRNLKNDSSKQWKMAKMAFATLVLAVKLSQVKHIKNWKISEESWKNLESVYYNLSKGPKRKVTLYKTLLNLHMLEEDFAMEFLHKFSNIVDKFGSKGVLGL